MEVEKKKRGRPRTRPLRYTEAERRLISYPPTKETWACKNTYGEENVNCGILNSGSSDLCWLCGKAKPESPDLVWPRYVAICEKVGIDPELRMSYSSIESINQTKKEGDEVRLFGRRKKVVETVNDLKAAPIAESVVDPISEVKIVAAPKKPVARKPSSKVQPSSPVDLDSSKSPAKTVPRKVTRKKSS